jgi:hypothetical protein
MPTFLVNLFEMGPEREVPKNTRAAFITIAANYAIVLGSSGYCSRYKSSARCIAERGLSMADA